MASHEERNSDFSTAAPTQGLTLKVLCEEGNDNYCFPYPCRWTGEKWINAETGAAVEGPYRMSNSAYEEKAAA